MSLPLAALGPSAYWYLARGTGAVSLLLLSASVVLGVLGPLRFSAGPRWPRFAIDSLHRDVSLLVMLLLLVHILTSVLDGFAPIKLTDALIPIGSSYRPLWLGLGALSFDLLVALVVTSLIRRRLGYGAWRAIHWLAYASWPVAVLHGLGTGTDTKAWWMLALTVFCACAVLIAVLVRIARTNAQHPGLQAPATALAIGTPLALAIFTIAGPLAPGWARKAGTHPRGCSALARGWSLRPPRLHAHATRSAARRSPPSSTGLSPRRQSRVERSSIWRCASADRCRGACGCGWAALRSRAEAFR
jgi:hypothetical protein